MWGTKQYWLGFSQGLLSPPCLLQGDPQSPATSTGRRGSTSAAMLQHDKTEMLNLNFACSSSKQGRHWQRPIQYFLQSTCIMPLLVQLSCREIRQKQQAGDSKEPLAVAQLILACCTGKLSGMPQWTTFASPCSAAFRFYACL